MAAASPLLVQFHEVLTLDWAVTAGVVIGGLAMAYRFAKSNIVELLEKERDALSLKVDRLEKEMNQQEQACKAQIHHLEKQLIEVSARPDMSQVLAAVTEGFASGFERLGMQLQGVMVDAMRDREAMRREIHAEAAEYRDAQRER